MSLQLLNDRLDALETCLLTMTELRGYLRKAENNRFSLCGLNLYDKNSFTKEIRHIDIFLTYLFEQEKHYRTQQQSKMNEQKMEQLAINERRNKNKNKYCIIL